MRFLSCTVKLTAYITAGILIIYYAVCSFCGEESIPVSHIPAILCAALATSAITSAVMLNETASRKAELARTVLHYLLICAVMIPFGIYMGWVPSSVIGGLEMAGYVLFVYLMTYSTYYITDLSDAEKMNNALKKRRNGIR